jgi:two-component system CheB/CheR fusion protein
MVKKSSPKTQAADPSATVATLPAPEADIEPPVKHFPVVGIGASAGGLAAFEAFFSGMPTDRDPGMAFVLVQHLAPGHKSILSDLVRRYTRMQVFEVEDGMVVKPNCAYIIPPNYDMAFMQGALHLLEPMAPRGQRLAIDYFFQSLAADQREHAIGVVLSGTGSDGTLGVHAIKGVGGMVMAQSTASSEFDGMPRSAIATGLVDYQLPPAEMPARLIAYATQAFGLLQRTVAPALPKDENYLKKIFVLLRAQTSHDFSQYKPSTIYRRIERRMAVHQIEQIESYVKYLQQNPPEVEALFRDLLIGVTNFFRDPEAFEVLADQVIPTLFAGKTSGSTVRIWSTGCSTGEEAYSLAILMVERMEVLKQSFTVQVFATDIDSRAIATARIGLYPASIAADISAERLARFFTVEPSGLSYRIHKGIRDLLVFSEHDLLKDPPFSKLDLICCRNLLIYLNASLQQRLIPLFHYALVPTGMLFLGSSEGVGDFESLFGVLDRKAKLYRRKEDLHGTHRTGLSRYIAPVSATQASLPTQGVDKPAFFAKLPLRDLTEQALLKHIAPASALVNAAGDILYLHGRTGMYLEPSAGEPGVLNILKMARDGLRPSLSTALHNAVATKKSIFSTNVRVKTNGHYTRVNLMVHLVPTGLPAEPDAQLYLVMLEDTPTPADVLVSPAVESGELGGALAADVQAHILALTQELHAKDAYLQSTHEELESSNEELKSSNEEMQSVNEELQSTNEELETSKEELQSVNEELATVNTELQTKVVDLSRANNDMNNLLAGTGIGTVFVDYQLRILRFTPAASAIINLIFADMGRPVAHIVSNLVNYTTLVDDVKAVLNTLVAKEAEVQTIAGQWFTLRIQPYRTLDNVIEGAVISFVDISEMVRVREALARTHAILEYTGELAQVGGWELDLRTMAMFWTLETFRIHELDPPVAPSLERALQFYAEEARPVVRAGIQAGIDHGIPWDFEVPLVTARGRAIWVRVQGNAVLEHGKAIKLVGATQDITERREVQEALRIANELLLKQVGERP